MATSTSVSRETSCRMARNHISTGIYSCATLDFDMKFCENSCSSRISADKRFYIMFVVTPHLNGRDFGVNQHRKFRPLFLFGQ